MPSGDGNVLTIHTNDGTERFRIDSSGNVKVGSACTISQDGDVFFTGVCTATTLAGSGANLTALPAANVTGTLPAISGANLTNLPAANVTGTLPAISGANLTNLTAGNLTGALPAISGANLTGIAATDNVRTGILDVAGIATFRDTVNIPNINGAQIGGRRNLIINGAMQIAQRSTSAVTIAGGKTYSDVDRFGQWTKSTEGSWKSGQQVADAPTDFQYSRKITSLAANTVDSSSYHTVRYTVEGYDAKQLNCGFSSAKTVTLSFYVKSSLTGTFGLNFTNASNARSYPTTYTISSADTWERKTITLTLDTSGTWPTDNGTGLEINWQLAMGSGSQSSTLNQWQAGWKFPDTGANTILTTNGATWQLTGVQLEVGSQATAFEHLSYSEELQLCKRYYEVLVSGTGIAWGGAGVMYTASEVHHQCTWVEKRATPSLTYTEGSTYYRYYGNGTNVTATRPNAMLYAGTRSGGIQTNSTYLSGSLLQGGAAFAYSQNASTHVAVDAEL